MGEAQGNQAKEDDLSSGSQTDRSGAESKVGEGEARGLTSKEVKATMNPQYRLTLIGAVTGSALTLAVSLILYFVAQSRQRRLWILDSKKAEWKELIGTLCQSARCMLDNSPGLGYTNAITVKTGDQERRSYEADSEARRAIQDRIFIAHRIQEEKILERWQVMTAATDPSLFWSRWNELHAALVKAAHTDLGIKE